MPCAASAGYGLTDSLNASLQSIPDQILRSRRFGWTALRTRFLPPDPMAAGVHEESGSRPAELDLILDFTIADDLAATVARGTTSTASEYPAGCRRELPGTHTLANNRSQLFFVHGIQSTGSKANLGATDSSCGFVQDNNYFWLGVGLRPPRAARDRVELQMWGGTSEIGRAHV